MGTSYMRVHIPLWKRQGLCEITDTKRQIFRDLHQMQPRSMQETRPQRTLQKGKKWRDKRIYRHLLPLRRATNSGNSCRNRFAHSRWHRHRNHKYDKRKRDNKIRKERRRTQEKQILSFFLILKICENLRPIKNRKEQSSWKLQYPSSSGFSCSPSSANSSMPPWAWAMAQSFPPFWLSWGSIRLSLCPLFYCPRPLAALQPPSSITNLIMFPSSETLMI